MIDMKLASLLYPASSKRTLQDWFQIESGTGLPIKIKHKHFASILHGYFIGNQHAVLIDMTKTSLPYQAPSNRTLQYWLQPVPGTGLPIKIKDKHFFIGNWHAVLVDMTKASLLYLALSNRTQQDWLQLYSGNWLTNGGNDGDGVEQGAAEVPLDCAGNPEI